MNIQSKNCSILQEYPQLNPAPAFLNSTTKGHFTLWPKVERPLISTNQIARNQEFGLSTLHTMTKVQRLSLFWMITFWRRWRTLEGSLDQTGMEAQTMVERPSVSFPKKSIIDKILAVRLEGLFWARNKVACSFGLWGWPLEASYYARPMAPLTIFY
jgi:hypothetical protein